MSDPRGLTERAVAYFMDLHLNSAVCHGRHEFKPDHWVYRLDAKARPMLVVRSGRNDRGCRWYHVLRITTKGCDAQGRRKPQLVSIGKLIDGDAASFVDIESHLLLPDTLIHVVDGKDSVVKTLDRDDFDNIVRMAGDRLLRLNGRPTRPGAVT